MSGAIPHDTDLSIEEIRAATSAHIGDALEAERPILIEAPPSSGKTRAAIELSFEEDRQITYLAARRDLYEQAKQIANKLADDEEQISYKVIPTPHRTCPTFKGCYDDGDNQLSAFVKRLYRRGYNGHELHYTDSDLVPTPCGETCPYLTQLNEIKNNTEAYDLVIGNHQHARSPRYLEERIVVIDEFNPDPFIESFPSDPLRSSIDHPGEIVPAFLDAVGKNDDSFPTDTYADLTDLLTRREDTEARQAALSWFEDRDEDIRLRESYSFFDPSSYRRDRTHRSAPILTFSLLCMERLGKGLGRAPPADDTVIQDAWDAADINPGACCVRDRNTGAMWFLEPPDLTPAKQVIGLDGTPTVDLWRRIYTPEESYGDGGFQHEQVIPQERFDEYLADAMDINVYQFDPGMLYYAGGRVSDRDEDRLTAIQAREGERFSLIAPKQALDYYDNQGWLERFIKEAPSSNEDLYGEDPARLALNYGRMLSSNVFENQQLGVVSGIPYPGDDVIRRWAAYFGRDVTAEGDGDEKTFGEFGDQIFRHFVHHQVVQALLRFGRDDSVDDVTVYVNTEALPEWITPTQSFSMKRQDTKATAVIEQLIRAARVDSRKPLAQQSVSSMNNLVSENIGCETIRKVFDDLAAAGLVTTHNKGKHGATLYEWDGDSAIQTAEDGTQILCVGTDVYMLDIE